jgi:hypothetical protein
MGDDNETSYSFEHEYLKRDSLGLIETRRGVNVTTTKNLNKTSDGRCTSASSKFDQFAHYEELEQDK